VGIVAPVLSMVVLLAGLTSSARAADQTFDAIFVDLDGLETKVTNLVYYWEEKLSETQLALHELKHVPARRGTVPIQIQFSKIRLIEFQSSRGKSEPILAVTLRNGKRGDFSLDIPGSFKGQTDFGEMIANPAQLQKILFQ
jgi:hypothetical protein